jgi:hypothetical protein
MHKRKAVRLELIWVDGSINLNELKQMKYEYMDLIQLFQARAQWRLL